MQKKFSGMVAAAGFALPLFACQTDARPNETESGSKAPTSLAEPEAAPGPSTSTTTRTGSDAAEEAAQEQ